MGRRDMRFSETLEAGFAGTAIVCDDCGRVVDILRHGSYWMRQVEKGALYAASPLRCWQCHEKAGQDDGES